MSRSYGPVEPTAVVNVPVVVTAPADPTGGAVTFSFTLTGATTPSVTFTAGTYDGTYNATTNEVDALTPLLPHSTATVELAVGTYTMRSKAIVGSETAIEIVGVLTVSDTS